ncbi:type II toxin-antitoxin system MqsA family antitoxin [Pseudomonas sp. DC3000-4b1]|uniref:type II toxin-antitoxin system MqsA family antitoxin n=1 Tax=unclassified Pseudomonas TaxID=196821 RepID=UPI003CFB1496
MGKKFSLDQHAASEIFGDDLNAFSRYERARPSHPWTLVQRLELLDRHPEPLDEVRMT